MVGILRFFMCFKSKGVKKARKLSKIITFCRKRMFYVETLRKSIYLV